MDEMKAGLPVAIIGAGPVGLAAAAHLIERGMTPIVFEAGAAAGENLLSYQHVRLFSPWRYNIDQAAQRLLESAGWQSPDPAGLPTAGELLEHYLKPLAALPEISQGLRLEHKVLSIGRQGIDKVKTRGREQAPFVIRAASAEGERDFLASAVLDASGTWSHANPLGANGLPAPGEAGLRDRIQYGMPDVLGTQRQRYAGRRVLVAGSGHSAAGTLLALAQLAEEAPSTRVIWVVRGAQLEKIFGGGAADGLPARGQLGARLKALQESGRFELHRNFRIGALRDHGGKIQVLSEVGGVIDGIDEIVAATGARPDLAITRELRVRHDPWLESTDALAPLIDPNEHSCGTVRPHGHRELAHPENNYYAIGAKSYGRAPNFLMVTGYEQVRSIAAALAGDLAAADDVQLALPETGICSTPFLQHGAAAGGCCGGPAPASANACCVLDASAKAEGKSGCGCGGPVTKPAACCA
jgi:thioredoxin reductase